MLKCKIITPQENKEYQELKSISLPTWSGQIEILPDHAESFILLADGDVNLKKINGAEKNIPIPGGECHIKDNLVNIFL